MSKHLLMSGLIVGLLNCLGPGRAEEPKPTEAGGLTVIDGNGKEQKLKTWKIVVGTRRLSWLSDAPAKEEKEKGKEKEQEKEKKVEVKEETGPEALEFREENSTNFAKGVLTYIPLDRIRAIDYDNDKMTAAVRLAVTDKPEADEVLTGPTKFQGENKLTIEAEVDKGDLGVAEVKFLAGIPKGIKGIRFPAPKIATALPAGRQATIIAADKEKSTFKASDLQPLYKLPEGGFKTMPTLMFKKTLKLDLAKIQKLRLAETGAKDASEYEVTLKDGEVNTLTLLKTLPADEKPPVLEGLVGRVGAGYKVFPIGMIGEVGFGEGEVKEK